MNTWIITDTHFWHSKLTENGFRPEWFEDKILKKLSKHIKYWDTVIHLWDFCIWDDRFWHSNYASILKWVNCILVKGNHDKKSNQWYYDHGWDFVCEQFTDTFFGKLVTFSHIPISWIDHLNIHGHTHWNSHRDDDFIRNDNQIEVALELNGYRPVSIKSLLS